ncbi:MAG: TlpA family protein disulfide reductase [Acidobacteria bacterium]|nr:TlpA family protein disulfide reductase [Acidobacteriota bacterium]
MRRIVQAAALLLATIVAHAQEARRAPALALRDIRGRSIRLVDYKGRVVLLNFWATWCPPCRAEVPDLVKAQRLYAKRGLQVVGVTYPPETPRAVRRFVRRLGVNYPVALGTKETRALFDKGETLPLTVVIDRDGNVRDVIEGILLPEEFEQKVLPLLTP